ncbi:MAG TPA: selenium metabolism-associated LysR family transcriptional regulator [Spirochaetota bacterium]|nr:selenium metabolism-associated LysR family transcriptional regulator [Spirochaetota bacterium]HPI90598.1 selenium metabolism-associated LysR family transcriptional regulator [Spirochaetota bacterium]
MKYKDLNFDVHQLRSFCEVTNEESFTRASRKLNLGQATISHHVSQLEKMLGLSLITRSSKEFSLTDEGKLFREFCLKFFEEIDSLVANVSEKSSVGFAVISASTIPSSYIIPPVIVRLAAEQPGFYYRVNIADSREVVETIKEGKIEIGVLGRKMQHPSLAYEKVFSDEIVLIGAQDMPDRVSVDDIPGLKMIMRERGSGTRAAVENALSTYNLHPSDLKIVYETTSPEGIKECVAFGMGVSFVSRLAIKKELALKSVKIIQIKNININRDFYLVYQVNRNLSRAAALFKEVITGSP